MEIFKFVTAVLAMTICSTTGQQLYSSFLHVLPTRIPDQIQLFYHLSWKQQSLVAGTCVTPICLKVYRMTNKTAQFFGRFSNFKWSCHRGCASNDVITDLSHFMFSEVHSYADVKWEAGEEKVVHTFKAKDADDITLRFQFSNGTSSEIVEDVSLNLRTRSDTKRPNLSPSVAVLPIYRIPLGCSTEVNLFPFDGDGDYTRCRWNISLPSAHLDKNLCKIKVKATAANGYVINKQYRGSVFLEDFSTAPVQLTRNGRSSVSSGPFSSTPIMFTIHVGLALASRSGCSRSPRFDTQSSSEATSQAVFTNYSSKFTAPGANVTVLTVGPGSVVFNKVVNGSSTTETADWRIINDTGVYKTCVMVYSDVGVPGETQCDTVLAADTDSCAQSNPCNKPCAQCTNYWRYHTCSNKSCNNDSLNIGLIVGTIVGSVMLAVAIATGLCLYLRYIGRKTKVTALKEKDKQQNNQ